LSSRARVVQITAKQVIYIVDMKTTAANDTNMESASVKPAKPLLFFVLLIMQVFDVLVVIACRACLCATMCEVRVGRIANSTFLLAR